MDLRSLAAVGAAIVFLAGCQTSSAQKSDDAVLRVAGTLQAIPLTLERCIGADPKNRVAYEEERLRYERDSAWVADAVYKVMERRIGSTRQGLESFIRGVGEKRIDTVFSSGSKAEIEKGCLKVLANCRMRTKGCLTVDQAAPDDVKAVIDEATR